MEPVPSPEGQGAPSGTDPLQRVPNQPGVYTQQVYDANNDEYFTLVIERGGVQPVKASNPDDIYYVYHKTVPKGNRILLEVPGATGDARYLPLTVVARLRANNPNVVGLGPEVIRKVFGVERASEIPMVTISYPD